MYTTVRSIHNGRVWSNKGSKVLAQMPVQVKFVLAFTKNELEFVGVNTKSVWKMSGVRLLFHALKGS